MHRTSAPRVDGAALAAGHGTRLGRVRACRRAAGTSGRSGRWSGHRRQGGSPGEEGIEVRGITGVRPRPQRLLEQPQAHDVAEEPDPAVDAALVGEVGEAAPSLRIGFSSSTPTSPHVPHEMYANCPRSAGTPTTADAVRASRPGSRSVALSTPVTAATSARSGPAAHRRTGAPEDGSREPQRVDDVPRPRAARSDRAGRSLTRSSARRRPVRSARADQVGHQQHRGCAAPARPDRRPRADRSC